MATLSRKARPSASLAPADHSTKSSKVNKASGSSKNSVNASDKSSRDKGTDISPTEIDSPKNVGESELKNGKSSPGNHNTDPINPADNTAVGTQAAAEGGQNTSSIEKASDTTTSTLGRTYTDFLAFANSNLPPPITDPSTATNVTISEAINKLYVLMQSNLHQSSTNMIELTVHFQTLEGKIDGVRLRQTEFEEKISHQHKDIKAQLTQHEQRVENLEKETVNKTDFDSLKTQFEELKNEMEERLQSFSEDMINIRLDNIRTANDTQRLEERINVHDLRAKKFSFIVEGFPETPHEKVDENLIARLNKDAGLDLTLHNFQSIRRIGKLETGKNVKTNVSPRPIALS